MYEISPYQEYLMHRASSPLKGRQIAGHKYISRRLGKNGKYIYTYKVGSGKKTSRISQTQTKYNHLTNDIIDTVNKFDGFQTGALPGAMTSKSDKIPQEARDTYKELTAYNRDRNELRDSVKKDKKQSSKDLGTTMLEGLISFLMPGAFTASLGRDVLNKKVMGKHY